MSEIKTGVGLISGGLDSTVVAAYMNSAFDQSHFLFANYGQKTLEREHRAFAEICDYYRPTTAEQIDLTWMSKIGNSALFDKNITLDKVNRKLEYVPFRNGVLLSAAVALAENLKADAVLIGSTGGDTTCPDNSQSFLDAMQTPITIGTMTDKPIRIVAPLISLDKKGVIELGFSLGAPLELSWSCHNNSKDVACGGCSNCEARRQGFADLGEIDPLDYEIDL